MDSRTLSKRKSNPDEKISTSVTFVSRGPGEGTTFTSLDSAGTRLNMTKIGSQQTNADRQKVFAKAPTEFQNSGTKNPNQVANGREDRTDNKAKTTVQGISHKKLFRRSFLAVGSKTLAGAIIKEETDSDMPREIGSLTKINSEGTTKGNQLKVGPEIFVNLKTGSIEDSYKTGHQVGEGKFFFCMCIDG